MSYLNFTNFYGKSEQSYSVAIAKTLAISEEFRKMFFELLLSLSTKPDAFREYICDDIHSISLEKDFGTWGRMDIVLETSAGLIIGIENKKWAGLQYRQLSRYVEAFEQIGQPYFLVFLTPKPYILPEGERPKSTTNGDFVHITYNSLLSIANNLSATENSLERNYYFGFSKFLEGLALPPLNANEISSMKYYYRAKEKVTNVLSEVNDEKKKIQENPNYTLIFRKIGNYDFFYGYRFGTEWYYNAPLLNNGPELICYVRDVAQDIKEATPLNEYLKNLYSAEGKNIAKTFDCQVDYYARKRPNECRFAIRKSISSFEGKELTEMVLWFKQALEYLAQQIMPSVTNDSGRNMDSGHDELPNDKVETNQ